MNRADNGLVERLRRWTGVERVSRQVHARPEFTPLAPYFRPATEMKLVSIFAAFAVLAAFVAGYYFAIGRQYVLEYLLFLLVPPMMLALWSAPDIRTASHRPLRIAFFLASVSLVVWPHYLAIGIPGLPWMSVSRMMVLISAICLILLISVHKETRTLIASTLAQHPLMRGFLIAFLAMQVITLPLSGEPTNSISHMINTQLYWTAMLFTAIVIFAQSSALSRWRWLMFWATLVICLIVVRETQIYQLPWVGHIPSFLQIDDPIVAEILAGRQRANEYRAQATFTTSLSNAEYLALIVPFCLSYIMTARHIAMRGVFAVFLVLLIWTIIKTGSRLGMVGLGICVLGYALLWGLRRRNLNRGELLGPTVIALYPAMFLLFSGAVLASNRLYAMFIGGGQHQASNEARQVMMERAIPMILQNPIGHGPGRAAVTLGYTNPSGALTIDNYVLNIGLEYGIVGLVSFFGLIIAAMFVGARIYITNRSPDAEFAGAAALALGTYMVVKTVLSQSQNQWLMFVLIGMIMAISYHHDRKPPRPGRPLFYRKQDWKMRDQTHSPKAG